MRINNELKVGIFIIAVIAMLGILTFKTGNFNFSKNKGYTIKVHFHTIDGVNLNSPVMFNGFEVGRVEEVNILNSEHETKMEVVLWIKEGAHPRKGVKAFVKNLGFMGEKYIALTSGDAGQPFIKAGDIIQGEEPTDFGELLQDGKEIAKTVKSITTNIDERLKKNKDKIDNIILNLDSTMANLSGFSANAKERLDVNKEHIDEIIANLNSVSANLDELSVDLKENPWKLLYRAKEK